MASDYPEFPINYTCDAAESYIEGAGGPTATVVITHVTGFSIQAMRDQIVDRSDDSQYPTIYDVVHNGYTWSLNHIDEENAQAWAGIHYLHQVQVSLHDAKRAGKRIRFWLQQVSIQEYQWDENWDELVQGRIGGFCSLLLTGDQATTEATATPVEGDLTIMRNRHADNYDMDGDFKNNWEFQGF